MVVDYSLSTDPRKRVFTAEGYQTDETIRCTVQMSIDKISINFKSYADGKITDSRGNNVYSVGDTLLSLEKQGGRTLTHWQAYPLPDDKPRPPEIDFVQAR